MRRAAMWRAAMLWAMVAWSAMAPAGITATYTQPDGQRIVVETGDEGQARATLDGDDTFGFPLHDARGFFVGDSDDGVRVIPIDDMEAAFTRAAVPAKAARAFGRSLSRDEKKAMGTAVTGTAAIGRRTVAGQAGTVYRIDHATRTGKAGGGIVVVSDAAALRPLHVAWQAMARAAGVILDVPAFNAAAPGLAALSAYIARVTALGALLDAPGVLTLTAIRLDTTPPAGRFDLPAVPLGLPEIEEMIRTAEPE